MQKRIVLLQTHSPTSALIERKEGYRQRKKGYHQRKKGYHQRMPKRRNLLYPRPEYTDATHTCRPKVLNLFLQLRHWRQAPGRGRYSFTWLLIIYRLSRFQLCLIQERNTRCGEKKSMLWSAISRQSSTSWYHLHVRLTTSRLTTSRSTTSRLTTSQPTASTLTTSQPTAST